jgi:hypothetical protein
MGCLVSEPGPAGTVAPKQPELETSAVQEEKHPAGICSRGAKPMGWHPARGHLAHQDVVRHRMKAAAKAARRSSSVSGGLAGTGLLPAPEGVHQLLHRLAGHVGISFDMGCLPDSAWMTLRRPGQDAGAPADCS